MADEPTWEDLFGGDPVTPPVQPPPAQPAQPTVPAPPVSQPPVQPSVQPVFPTPPAQPVFPPQSVPTQSAPSQSAPTQSVPSVPAHSAAVPPPLVQPQSPSQPTYQPPQSPLQAPPGQDVPTYAAQQPAYQPQQPSYVSQLPPAPTPSYTPPQADSSRRSGGGDDAGRRGGGSGRGSYRGQKPPRKRKLTWLWVLIVLFVLGAGGAGLVYAAFPAQVNHVMGWEPTLDYSSATGNGKTTTITILPGQIGADVANSLAKAGVTKTNQAFYDLLLKQKKAPNFEPGTYKLGEQISAKAALAEISDPANRVVSKVVIPEGFNLQQILTRLNTKTGVPMSQLQAEAKNFTQFGLPAGAPNLEGFLFPATYDFSPGTTAKVMLQAMVTRMDASLKSHGVAPADELKVLTLASIIQKEGGTNTDFYKVSRVFANRLAINMPLQSDATVSYGAGSKTISTTGAQRADASNPYNTYAHAGLPIGPIAAPGDTAIDAALHPVAGPWIYFVLVNGYTGETVYSTTAAGQAAGVKQWQTWLKAHPGYGS
jgi:UPF0755 protein